jgi:uncharacterized membrane protein YGL010W
MDTKKASFSIPSILAIIAAILSFTLGPILGLLMAALALIFGVLGLVLALSPKTRGGGLSIIAVILSFIGVIAAIVKAIMWAFTLG